MIYSILADIVVVVHFLFILFVLSGGLFITWRKWIIFIHLPAVIWACLIEFKSWICPLTPLEKWLRESAGANGYQEGFIEHYLMPVIYPSGLTEGIQVVLGVTVIVINLCIYSVVFYKLKK